MIILEALRLPLMSSSHNYWWIWDSVVLSYNSPYTGRKRIKAMSRIFCILSVSNSILVINNIYKKLVTLVLISCPGHCIYRILKSQRRKNISMSIISGSAPTRLWVHCIAIYRNQKIYFYMCVPSRSLKLLFWSCKLNDFFLCHKHGNHTKLM